MDQNPESFQNQPLSDLEKRRIESEIAKNEAERIKFTLEAEEVRRRLSQKWYSGWFLIKLVVGGIVLSALIANWAIFYFAPMLQTKQINAELDNAKLAKENWTQTQINEQQRQENEEQKKLNEKQRQENERLTNENRKKEADLKAAADNLKNIYDFLVSKLKLSVKNPVNIAELLKSVEQRFNVLNQDIVQLRLKTIYFDSTSFELRPDAKASLYANFETLQEFPDIKIRIEAFGDGVMWNMSMEHRGLDYKIFFDRDLAIGEKRARKVIDYLTGQGISASRITIVGHPGEPKSTRRSCRFVVVNQ